MDTNIEKQPSAPELAIASDMLKLVSDPTRLQILWALLHGEHSVNELADHVHVQPSAVSQHLGKLRLARLVKARREGNKMFYSTENKHVHIVIKQALAHAEHQQKGHENE